MDLHQAARLLNLRVSCRASVRTYAAPREISSSFRFHRGLRRVRPKEVKGVHPCAPHLRYSLAGCASPLHPQCAAISGPSTTSCCRSRSSVWCWKSAARGDGRWSGSLLALPEAVPLQLQGRCPHPLALVGLQPAALPAGEAAAVERARAASRRPPVQPLLLPACFRSTCISHLSLRPLPSAHMGEGKPAHQLLLALLSRLRAH